MTIAVQISEQRQIGRRSPLLYGQFIEHFHRQIYDGVFDPDSPLSDEDGFRTDVIEAMRRIRVPILRWPGGCFVSSYHWKDAVGNNRTPMFDKAWRVEDPNTFGTDEYIALCRKIGCAPYICTNAGTGTPEEMSDWVEYCNLEREGQYARWRKLNGHSKPYGVRYWSIGNENYGHWEIGAKTAAEWALLVRESAKMMKHVDPLVELSAAALPDIRWNVALLEAAGEFLDWISIHAYWDRLAEINDLASYTQCMAYTKNIDHPVTEVRGLLQAMGLDKKIRIAFDEWNLRGWHHPNVHTIQQGVEKSHYLEPRDRNDDNNQYTMADAVFTAVFLNAMNRNCDIVGMANFAPVLNTRGCIFSHGDGIVLRSTYHVFDLYVNRLGDTVVDLWAADTPTMIVLHRNGQSVEVDTVDLLATTFSDRPGLALAAVNKHPDQAQTLELNGIDNGGEVRHYCLNGPSVNSYNDIDRDDVRITEKTLGAYHPGMTVVLPPHSVNVIDLGLRYDMSQQMQHRQGNTTE